MTEQTETKEQFFPNIAVTFDSEVYAIPPVDYDDVELMEAFEAQKWATITRIILGPDGWKRFTSKKRKSADLIEILHLINDTENRALGLED